MINKKNNSQSQKTIAWEKWFDPFGSDAKESQWPGAFGNFETDNLINKIKNSYEYNEEYEEEYIEDTDITQLEDLSYKQPQPIGMMLTPMGMIPVTEHTRAGNIFNFWIAHCNFRITESIAKILDNTDGIETLDILTPYRWRISIGKAFNTVQVKENVQKNLGALPTNAE